MSIVTLPANLRIGAGGGMGQARFDLLTQSDSSGAQQVRMLAPPRWTLRLVQPDNLTQTDGAAWQSLALRLRGRVNVLAAWDTSRPAPLGTARGTMLTSGSTAIGATSVAIAGATHRNLLRHTQEMSGASWGINVAVTPNTHVAPDGTITADTITDSSSAAPQVCGQTVTVPNDAANYVFSAYVRKTTGGVQPTFLVHCLMNGGTGVSILAYVNTDTGAALAGAFIVADAGAYWRVMVPLSNNGTGNTSASMGFYPAASAFGVAGIDSTRTGSAVVWGAQLERASAATDYAPGATLLAGDWLQIGTGLGTSQLCMVTTDAVADAAGLLTVSVEPPLRLAVSPSTAVAWDKPVAYYRQQTDASTWTMANGGRSGPLLTGQSFDLLETWS